MDPLQVGKMSSPSQNNKNAIINGNFNINQEGVSGTVVLAADVYGHDMFRAGASGCTYTFATVENVTTLTITAGSLLQTIEGINLYSGTYVLSWSGTAQAQINSGTAGDSGMTGTATGGTDLEVEFGTGTISKVQFEAGSIVTEFERRTEGQEFELCERYYELWKPNLFLVGTFSNISTQPRNWYGFRTVKRAPPAIILSSAVFNSTSGYSGIVSLDSATEYGATVKAASSRVVNTNEFVEVASGNIELDARIYTP